MNAFIFHMLMQAREFKTSRQKKIVFGKGTNTCPFCSHDFRCANWEVQSGNIEDPEKMELTCWRCPLLSIMRTCEDKLALVEDCERIGKHFLADYEQFFDGGDTAWDDT